MNDMNSQMNHWQRSCSTTDLVKFSLLILLQGISGEVAITIRLGNKRIWIAVTTPHFYKK